jgi:phage tail sheath gpL-like
MSMSFNNIPAGLRVPLFYAEMDNSAANSGNSTLRTLLIGQVNDDAEHESIGQLTLVSRTEQAAAIGGMGSMLHAMHRVYRRNDSFGQVWCLPLKLEVGAAATGSITITNAASASGVLTLYVAGQRVQVSVVNGDSAAQVAAAVLAAITAATGLPVTAAAGDAGQVKLKAKFKGLLGNDIQLQLNRLGTAGGESTPMGLTVALQPMVGGVGTPELAEVLAAVGDEAFEFVGHPFTDVVSLTALREWMNDTTGRWSWAKQIYGHCYSAQRGQLGQLVAAGSARNDQHSTVHGFELGVAQPAWEVAAGWTARTAVFISIDPARPTQTGVLTGIDAAPPGERFLLDERQALLTSGVATAYVEGGEYRIERAITTYQKNAFGAEDDSYLDSETLHTSAYVLRYLRAIITSKYPRHKLANDGTKYGPGQAIVTPVVIRGELIAAYRTLEERGIVENAELFKQHLIVERAGDNPNRLNVLFPPDYVNQLRVFAVRNEFRLQYSETAE